MPARMNRGASVGQPTARENRGPAQQAELGPCPRSLKSVHGFSSRKKVGERRVWRNTSKVNAPLTQTLVTNTMKRIKDEDGDEGGHPQDRAARKRLDPQPAAVGQRQTGDGQKAEENDAAAQGRKVGRCPKRGPRMPRARPTATEDHQPAPGRRGAGGFRPRKAEPPASAIAAAMGHDCRNSRGRCGRRRSPARSRPGGTRAASRPRTSKDEQPTKRRSGRPAVDARALVDGRFDEIHLGPVDGEGACTPSTARRQSCARTSLSGLT